MDKRVCDAGRVDRDSVCGNDIEMDSFCQRTDSVDAGCGFECIEVNVDAGDWVRF